MRHGRGLLRRDEAALDGQGGDLVGHDTPPVVGDGNDDVITLLRRGHGDGAGLRLPRRAAFRPPLQTMVDGVAQQVHEGLEQPIEHVLLHRDVAALQLPAHQLAGGFGRLAHHAVEPDAQAAEGHQPDAHQRILDVGVDPAFGGLQAPVARDSVMDGLHQRLLV